MLSSISASLYIKLTNKSSFFKTTLFGLFLETVCVQHASVQEERRRKSLLRGPLGFSSAERLELKSRRGKRWNQKGQHVGDGLPDMLWPVKFKTSEMIDSDADNDKNKELCHWFTDSAVDGEKQTSCGTSTFEDKEFIVKRGDYCPLMEKVCFYLQQAEVR